MRLLKVNAKQKINYKIITNPYLLNHQLYKLIIINWDIIMIIFYDRTNYNPTIILTT